MSGEVCNFALENHPLLFVSITFPIVDLESRKLELFVVTAALGQAAAVIVVYVPFFTIAACFALINRV